MAQQVKVNEKLKNKNGFQLSMEIRSLKICNLSIGYQQGQSTANLVGRHKLFKRNINLANAMKHDISSNGAQIASDDKGLALESI